MKTDINILIIDDSKVFAEGLELLLEQYELIQEIHHKYNLNDSLEFLKNHPVLDIVILDLDFGSSEYDGFSIAEKIKQLYPTIKIIILTEHTRINHYETLFDKYDVDAYLDKRLGVSETHIAIKEVINGNKYIDENIRKMLEITGWMEASKREKEVISLLVKGLVQKQIADELGIKPKTVEVHIRNLFAKFKVKNSVELIAKYLKYKNSNRENIDESLSPFKNIE
jgi:DNA-binding NarL/FixJ family response regulator